MMFHSPIPTSSVRRIPAAVMMRFGVHHGGGDRSLKKRL
jgi:hypothetical protein